MKGNEMYQTSKTEATIKYRNKLNDWIAGGKIDAEDFLKRVEREAPRDKIINTNDLRFDVRDGKVFVSDKDEEWLLHKNAVTQMVGRTEILSSTVADKMMSAASNGDKWGRELLLHNLHTIFQKTERERVLLRAVSTEQGPEVRGFLSDKYRRMNAGPIIQSFAESAISDFGAVPIRTGPRFQPQYYHDTRNGFSLWLPHIFEPTPNECVLLGLMVQNSDFGVGALTVSLLMLRLICTNGMIAQDELRKVHLGARLSSDIHFSERTHRLDTETMASAVRDITRNLFLPARVNMQIDRIHQAAELKVEDPKKLFESMRTGGKLNKSEAAEIAKLFNEPEIEMMPAGQNLWRASNAISLFSNKTEEAGRIERAVELRHVAGEMIDKYTVSAAA